MYFHNIRLFFYIYNYIGQLGLYIIVYQYDNIRYVYMVKNTLSAVSSGRCVKSYTGGILSICEYILPLLIIFNMDFIILVLSHFYFKTSSTVPTNPLTHHLYQYRKAFDFRASGALKHRTIKSSFNLSIITSLVLPALQSIISIVHNMVSQLSDNMYVVIRTGWRSK